MNIESITRNWHYGVVVLCVIVIAYYVFVHRGRSKSSGGSSSEMETMSDGEIEKLYKAVHKKMKNKTIETDADYKKIAKKVNKRFATDVAYMNISALYQDDVDVDADDYKEALEQAAV
jgi:hypothetical protein